ncbi:MAG: hypothetical protein AAF705_21640, partial [Bacteroidota bacterium]
KFEDTLFVKPKGYLILCILFLSPFFAVAQDAPNFEHPRGLLKAGDVLKVRERIKQQSYAKVLEQMKEQQVSNDAKNRTEWSSYQLADAALKSAQIFLLTDDLSWADQSQQYVEEILQDSVYFLNPIGRGLTKVDQLLKVMMAYDYCYKAWELDFKKRFSTLTYEAILTLSSNMGLQANYNLASNWMGVRYGTVLYAALIWDDFEEGNSRKSKIRPFIYDATKRISDFALANVHPDGWNVESLGYQTYGWSFVYPALIAWENHFGQPIADLGFYDRMLAGQQSMAIASVTIQNHKGIGIKPDLSDDGLAISNRLVPYIIHLAPDQTKPYFRWINRSFNAQRKGPVLVDGGFESILYDDPEQVAIIPPESWLNFISPGQGTVTLRNRFKDEQDIVFSFSTTSSRKGHQGGDNLSFRLMGLNNIWVIGSGRTNWTGGQTSFFPATPTDSSRYERVLGKLEKVKSRKGQTTIVGTGSCTGVQNHTRSIQASFDAEPGNPVATFMVDDISDNGKIWRLNTPEFNQIHISNDGFEII